MANRIKELRKARNVTQQQVAEYIGTTAHTIGRLERGEMTLTAEWMQRIAAAIGVAPGELFPQLGEPSGKVVQSEEEVKVLVWWRRMNRNQKFAVIEFAKSLGLNPTINSYRPASRRPRA